MKPLLEVSDLSKHFGGVKAVDGFSVTLHEGEIRGLIGPNGAGKTTVFNVVTGFYPPTSGDVRLRGKAIGGMKPHEIARAGVARTFQNIRLFANLTVFDNVLIASHMQANYGLLSAISHLGGFRREDRKIREEAERLLELVGLADRSGAQAGSLPYGHQRKLEIARALALRPSLLLLDEPAAGMNAGEERELVQFIRRVRDEFGLTIMIIEHHMDVAMTLCDRITVLNFGRTIAEGTPREIKKNPAVIDAYLGEADAAC